MDSQNSTLESDLEAENVKVFVLTPSDLASIGLVTKVENGQAVLLPAEQTNNVDTSTTLSQIIARKRSLSFKDVATLETPLEKASTSASESPSILRKPKRKDPDEQDVTITIVKQNDMNTGLNAATGKNLEDVTVTVSKLASASRSILRSDVTSPRIKRPCGHDAHRATSRLGNATNSPQMRTTDVNNPRGPADASQVKTAAGNTNVMGKGVIVSPVKTGCKTNHSKPYGEKEKWTPNLIKRTCKLTPMKKSGETLQSLGSQSVGSADVSSTSSCSNTPVKARVRRMVQGFAQYWLDSLDELGYIRCPLRACNYISLSYQDMSVHYATCAGVSDTSENMCPVCQKRLNTPENVKLHLIRSHGPKSKHQEVAQSEPSIKSEPTEDPPQRLLVRKRGYSKVHKVSWSIALEDKGYIKCLFQNCGFLALSLEEMIKHYGICNGSGSSAHIPCPFCNGRVENLDKLDKHILISHAEESKKPDAQTEIINVVGTPDVTPALSQNSKDSPKMTVGRSATRDSFATNASELYSHQIDQAQKTIEYIVPDMMYEDFEDRVNSVKSFSNLPTKNGSDSLENLITGSYGENNFLVPEKQRDSVSIRLSEGQSTHCEVVGTESNRSHINAREKISNERYNVRISETVVVSVDPQDITEVEGMSANSLASDVGYETISLNISDITDLEKGIRVTQTNVNAITSSQGSSVAKVNINELNKEDIPLASAAVPGCDVSVIQANTLNMKNLNIADPVFSSSANGTNNIQGVISVNDLCSGNSKQEILTKSTTDANCFKVSNISSHNSNIAYNDTVCADNLDNGNKTWQKTGIRCPKFIQSKILLLSDSCDTETRKPLSDVNKLAETAPFTNKQPGSHVGPSQKDLVVCPLPNSRGLDRIKNVITIGSAPNVQQRLISRDEDIDIELLSYSAAIIYPDKQWRSKLSEASSGLRSPPHEKSVTDKSRLKTYSKKNSPSSLNDQTKNHKSPSHANSQVLFGRPSAVTFEEDVYVKKGTEATVAAASTSSRSDQYNEEHVPVRDSSSHECGNSVPEERQSDRALSQEGSKHLGTLATGAVADTKLIDVDVGTFPDGDKVHITPDFTCKQGTDVTDSVIAASAGNLSPGVHNSVVVEENKSSHSAKVIDQPEPASESSEVQKCVAIANTSTQNSEITVSSVSDGSFVAPSVENICDDSQDNNKQPFCNVQLNVYELESSKEEQNELITKPSIDNFVQEMNIDYISPEADKFMVEDESLSMYLNNSDEFQDKNLLENDTALMPIGSCESNQHTTTSNKSSAKGTVSTIVKENSESTTLQNTINCDMLSTEIRETNILTPDSFDKIPDVTLTTEVGKTHITTETEESEEPAGANTQSKDDERHSSSSESKSTAITAIASDKQDITSCSSTNVTDEVIDNSHLFTSSVVDGSVEKDINTLCEKQSQEENEGSLAVTTTDTILNMEDTPCTLCMEEQNSSVSVIRSLGKYSDDKTEHYDRTKENNSNNNSFDVRMEDLAISNSIKEDPNTESACDVSLAHSKNTVEPQQCEGVCSIYPHDNKGECIVPQIDVTTTKVKDEQSETIIQAHKALNVPCENDALAHIRETRVNLNDMDTKNRVPSEYLPIPDAAISNQETKTTVLVTSLIEECKSETEGFKSSCPLAEVANDVKSGRTANIPMCQEHLSTDSNERKLKDGPDEESIETHEVHLEENSSTCVRETTVNLDDIEMKNALPSECSLKLVPPLSDQASKAAVLADSLIKECKSETEDVKCSGPHNVAVVADNVKQEKPTNIPMPQLHLSRESSEVTNVCVKCEDCTEDPSNPTSEKEGCEDQNLGNLKAGVVVKEANEPSQPQQTDFSQKLVCSVAPSDDVEDRLIAVHPGTSSQQLIPDTATLKSSEDKSHTVSGDGNPACADVVSICRSSMSTDSSWCNSNSLETSNSEDTSPGSSVNAVSVSSECGASGNQQLDDESVVCMDEIGVNSKEECTARRASSSSIPPGKQFLNYKEHSNDNSEQPTGSTVKSENCDDCIDFNKSLCHLCDSVADKVATNVDEVSADTSLILGDTDSEADVLNCKNVSSVNNEESASRKLKSDDLDGNGYLCDKEEISVIDNHSSSESEENSKEHENVQNLSLPRDYKDIMATSDDECKEKINVDGNSQIPVKVFCVQDSANVTTEQEVNSCLVPAESMNIDLKLNAGPDVTVCNANVVDSALDTVKTESSPISVKENTEIVSCTGTSTAATLSENTADIPALSSEIEEPGPTLLPANEKSSSEAVCDVSKNASAPLTASKICRKRKNSECTNMDNSNSKIQILEFDGDKLAKPSSVKASVETAQYNPSSDESHREETSTDNFCNSPERKLQLSCNVSNSNVMSSGSRCENTEETTDSLKTSATDDDGDTPCCHEYSEFRKTRDVSESKVCSQNGEELENSNVGVSGLTKSKNNRLSDNDCNDTVGAQGMRMDATESDGALQCPVNGQKRKNSQQELRIPENGVEMPLEKKKHISSPVQITEYPERPEGILESVALRPTKLKAELSTPKCAYNTRHKGTLHTVLKLDQASGFCSPVIGKGRGRGRGVVKEETTEQCVGSPPGDRGRGRGRGRARGRGRGRGRGGAAQEPVGDPTPPEEAAALPGPLVTENEVSNTTSSDAASSGTVPAVKRKRGRQSLKPQPVERAEVADILHREKKEDGPSSSSNVPHDVDTNIKSSSSVANAGVNESEENDKAKTREGEEKTECKNIHSDLENKPVLKENGGGFMTGRGKRTKRRNYKLMLINDSMFSSEDEQSKEGNANDDTFEDGEYSPQRTKRGRREERSASTSKTPSRQNGKSLEGNIINESSDLEGSNTATTGEGDLNNACKNIKSEIKGKSFLKENEESVMTSQRKESVKQEEARNDKVIVSNDSMFSSEDGQSKEGNTFDNTFERDEYSPQRTPRGARRACTNKIPSKQNGKSQGNTSIKREGDQNNECKNIIPKFEEESFLKEDEDKATTTLRRSSGRRGRLTNYKMTESNESMFSNGDEESDEGNAVDDTFEDEEYLPEPKIRGRRTSNRVSGIPGGDNREDSTTNEKSEEGLIPGQRGRRGTRQGRRGKSSACKTEPRNDSDKDEQSGEDNFSDESCEDKEYSPYKRRKAQVRKKTGTFGKRRARGKGKATTSSAGEQGLAMEEEDSKEIQVKCGKCAEEMTNRSFDAHNYQKHNGLGWIEGQEPIDTADEKAVQRILFKMRKKGKKSFVCEICDDVKKSVVGFMSHLQFCQKTTEEREAMKERCPFCERCLIPSSMKVHLQLHRSEHERQQQEEELISSSNQARKHKRAAAEKAATLMQEFIKGVEDDEPSEEQKADKDELFKQLGYTRPSNSLRGRWRMAITRNGKIKCNNPGCVFDTSEVGEMEQHYANCPRAPRKGYVCKLCDHHCNQESEIREHLKEHENTNPAEDSDSSGVEEDFDGEVFHERTGVLTSLRVGKPKNKRYKLANKMTFLARESSGSVIGDRVFAAALRWTAKFHVQHYKDSLFPLYHTSLEDWTAVEESLIGEYLPAARESMMISQVTMKGKVVDLKQQDMEWRKYNLFEAAVKDDAVTVFVGGPVWAMAWCPLPFRLQIQEDPLNTKQYLAITCHRSMEDQYSTSRSYSGPGLIQMWCFEDLDSLKSPPIPFLDFAIAHNYGAVWCMEWCPSGCYERKGCDAEEEHLRRLGLLAAACSDGCVHIFSVCHPDEVIRRECERYPVFKAEPVVSLMLEEDEETKLGGIDWQCLRLTWCKVNGHRIIAASFSNGMVALWDIETSSRLLYRICGKRKLIYPYHTFQPHGGPVTALAMSPLNERFLMTGSYDRTCKFWDTRDTAEPITSTFKGLVTDGIWLTHWPSAVSAYDDVYSRCHTNSTLTPVRNFGYSPYPLLAQNSVAWGISSCDWVNSVAQGTSAGELSAIFLHQLLIGVDTEKGMKNKRMILSYAELVNFKESVSTSELSESAGKVEEDTVKQETSAAESMTIDAPSLASPDAQASFGADSGKSPKNENVANGTHSDSACGSSTDRQADELLLSESRDDDRSVNDPVPTVKQGEEHDESRQTNDTSMDESCNDVKEVQKTEQFPEDATCASFSSVRDCETDPLACDDSQSVLSTEVTSPSCSQASEASKKGVRSKQSDSERTEEAAQEKLVLNPRTYSEVEKSFGVVLCDFPTDDFSKMPQEARLWMRQSDQMRMFPTEMYPVLSINRVAWNPNFRSFLWVASGYQNGLVRLKCVSAMYTQDVAKNMLRLRDAYS